MEQLDCLFIGSATQDILLQVDAPPASDARIAARAMTTACGGVAATACAAFHRLGGRVGLISAVGGDEAGAFIRGALEARALPFLQLQAFPEAASPFSSILVENDGKRLIVHYGGCMQYLDLARLDADALRSARMIHIGGLPETLAIELVRELRGSTTAKLSLDGGNYSRAGIEKMLPCLDIFIPDKRTVCETLDMPAADACRYYASYGVRTVCITLGAKGAVALADGKFYFEEPLRGARIVDTTGAGDNFHGAFLYSLQQGHDMSRTLRFANAFAGCCCEGLGGAQAQPTLEQTLDRMQKPS